MNGIGIRWFDEARNVIIQEYSAPWTWDDLSQAMLASFDLIRQANGRAALIVDLHRPEAVWPGSAGAFSQFQKLRTLVVDNLKLIIVVGAGDFLRTLGEAFLQAVARPRVRIEFVNTLQEVEAVLQQYHPGS